MVRVLVDMTFVSLTLELAKRKLSQPTNIGTSLTAARFSIVSAAM